MSKWRVFREKVPRQMRPRWVVWDDNCRERLFLTGGEALSFVRWELTRRGLAQSEGNLR